MPSKKPPIKIALNGFGRVGRAFFKLAWDDPELEIVAINTRSDADKYAHLLRYDSIYGIWDKKISAKGKNIIVDGKKIPFSGEANGGDLPWKKYGVDVVVDATGKRRKHEEANMHIKSGAKYVVVTSPMDNPDLTVVRGVNDKDLDPKIHKIIAAASCTSVCSALSVKVLEDSFGIERGMVTTVHALTGSQGVIDSVKNDLRKARAATESIIPTTTGAAKTLDKLFPHLRGKLSAMSIRVPIALPSLISFTAQLKKPATQRQINQAFTKASKTELADKLAVTDEPLVSIDFKQNPHGAIIDLLSTTVTNKKMATVLAWYDNEWGYTSQTVKLVKEMADKINGI